MGQFYSTSNQHEDSIHANSDNNDTPPHESASTSGSFDSDHPDHAVSATPEFESNQLHQNNIQNDNDNNIMNENSNADSRLSETTNATELDAINTSPVSNRTQHLQGTDDSDNESILARLRERLLRSRARFNAEQSDLDNQRLRSRNGPDSNQRTQDNGNNNNSSDRMSSHGNVNGDSSLNNGNSNNDTRLRNRVLRPATRNSAQRSSPIDQTSRPSRRNTNSVQNSSSDNNNNNNNNSDSSNNNHNHNADIQSQTQQQQQQQQETQDHADVGVASEEGIASPFARMITEIVTEAVGASFRNTYGSRTEQEAGIRQEVSLHLSPELFRQLEPDQAANTFMRFMRLPVMITNINEQLQPPSEVTQEMRLPMFLYGLRTNNDGSVIQQPTEEELSTQRQEENTRFTSSRGRRMSRMSNHIRNTTSSDGDNSSNDINESTDRRRRSSRSNVNTRSNNNSNDSNNDNVGTSSTMDSSDSNDISDTRIRSRDGDNRRRRTRERSASPELQLRRSERIRNQRSRTYTEEGNEDNSNDNNNDNTSNVNTNNQNDRNDARVGGTQWRVYIISGNSSERWFNNTDTIESLLGLMTFMDGVTEERRPTATQESIDQQLPLVKYSEEIQDTVLGRSDECPVCFEKYELLEDVRLLNCRHVFHKTCLDKWLTEQVNQCPLCRREAVSS